MKKCMNMYENNYKNTALSSLEEFNTFLQLLADQGADVELFAMGGTAMVLAHIKEATKDIDFMTESSYASLKRLLETAGLTEISSGQSPNIWKLDDSRIDIFYGDHIMGVSLPDDWKSLSKLIKTIGSVKIYTLNWYDIIITKLARSEGRDIDDILAIISHEDLDFAFLKKRYYGLAEESIIAEYDIKFKHLERKFEEIQ